MTDRIRLTITVTPEVHAIFSRMAEVAGLSLGKCMGEWLADTSDGAQFVSLKMAEARKAPKLVMREMQAMVHGLSEEVDATLAGMRKAPAVGAGASGPKAKPRTVRAGPVPPSPPSSNTGGKVPRVNPNGQGRKGS